MVLRFDVGAGQVLEDRVADLELIAAIQAALLYRLRFVVHEGAIGGGEIDDEDFLAALLDQAVTAREAVARQYDVVVLATPIVICGFGSR